MDTDKCAFSIEQDETLEKIVNSNEVVMNYPVQFSNIPKSPPNSYRTVRCGGWKKGLFSGMCGLGKEIYTGFTQIEGSFNTINKSGLTG